MRPLIFAHVILTQKPGTHQAKEILARISRRIDLWESGSHAVLVGGIEEEGASREGRVAREEGDEEVQVRQFHDIVLYGNLCQAVQRLTAREGGGCLLPGEVCTNTGQMLADVLREKQPDMSILQVGYPRYSAF